MVGILIPNSMPCCAECSLSFFLAVARFCPQAEIEQELEIGSIDFRAVRVIERG